MILDWSYSYYDANRSYSYYDANNMYQQVVPREIYV